MSTSNSQRIVRDVLGGEDVAILLQKQNALKFVTVKAVGVMYCGRFYRPNNVIEDFNLNSKKYKNAISSERAS